MGRKSRGRKRKGTSSESTNNVHTFETTSSIAHKSISMPDATHISPLLSINQDIYNSICQGDDRDSMMTLAINPPTHWFHSIPTFPYVKDASSRNSFQSSDFVEKRTKRRKEGSDIFLYLTDHLNILKSTLLPFCEILSELKHSKIPLIRTNPQNEFRRVSRSPKVNPYESICSSIQFNHQPLLSRSALKLCNIDAITGFCMMDIKEKKTRKESIPIFVDLCGAPGGFSQYLLFRYLDIKGYGMSLHGTSDDSVGLEWKVDELLGDAGSSSSCHNGSELKRFMIHNGSDGTGDIQNWDNALSLQTQIEIDAIRTNSNEDGNSKCTIERNADKKATIVVADGGIDAQRNNNDQESVAHRLVCCQVAAALLLLETGGHFVLKMFGFQTKRTRSMMKFLSTLFGKIQVIKPIASRPASAERYVMFHNFRGVGKNFDILRWRDNIIDGDLTLVVEKEMRKSSYRISDDFEDFLDTIDHNMLSLNIRACSNIIACLREEEDKIRKGKRERTNRFCETDLELNVEYIKKQWQIPTNYNEN